jgi:nucleoside-diphosphate-sugar epimerase
VRVLVTGAGGFVGAAVLAGGLRAGDELRAHTGPGTSIQADGAADLPSVSCDITDAESLAPLVAGVDAVVHLAGPPSVAASFADPTGFLRAHVLGTATVARLCRAHSVKRMVYVSSAEVYGVPSPPGRPVSEDAPTAPRSPYAAAKVGAEAVLGAAARSGELEAVVLRPFSVYGPGMRPTSVLGTIVEQVLRARRETRVVVHDLRPVRDYCHVDDVAAAVWRACAAPAAGAIRTYNVGTGRGTSVAELAAVVMAAASRTGPIVEGGPADRPAACDIPALVADVDRARSELGWTAETMLEAGLRQVLRPLEPVAARC